MRGAVVSGLSWGEFDFRTSQGGCVGAPIKGVGCVVDGGRVGGPYNGTCETLLRTGWPQEWVEAQRGTLGEWPRPTCLL